MQCVAAIASLAEIAFILTAWCVVYRRNGLSLSLSVTYGIVSLLALLSVAAQLILLTGLASYSAICDAMACIYAYRTVARSRVIVSHDWKRLVGIFREHRLSACFGMILLLYAGLQAIVLPPFNNDSLAYNLARVLVGINENTLMPDGYTALHQVVFPLGYDVLHFWILRFNVDWGIGIFGFLCYVGVLTGTYAVASRGTNRVVALLAVVAVGTYTEIVLMATSTKNDLPCGLLALTSLLALAAYEQDGKRMHLMILAVALAFGLGVKTYFVGWLILMMFYAGFRVWMHLSHHGRCTSGLDNLSWLKAGVWPVPLLAFSVLFYFVTWSRFGHPLGPDAFRLSHSNQDGLAGAVANACRYAVQLLQWPKLAGGDLLTHLHDRILGVHAGMGAMAGAEVDLAGPSRAILPQEDLAWYGMTFWMFSVPAMVWVLLKGKSVERGAAGLCLCFAGLVCMFVGWCSSNGRFFATIACCSAFWLRDFLTWLSNGVMRRYLFITLCLLQGMYALLLNMDKPVIDVYGMAALVERTLDRPILNRPESPLEVSNVVPFWLRDVVNREHRYNELFGNQFVSVAHRHLANTRRIGIVAQGQSIYPFLIKLPLPLDELVMCESLDILTLESVDAILVLGQDVVPSIRGFEAVAVSDMGNVNCQKGILLKRVSL